MERGCTADLDEHAARSFDALRVELGMPKAHVSTSVQALETQLGTRLLQRTTRSVRMTPDGEVFYERCKVLFTDLDELGSLFQQVPSDLYGRLRVGALRDSGLIARQLGRFRMVNYASPAYLEAHGTPVTLDDLDHHHLIHYARTLGNKSPGWEYFDGTQWRFKPMQGAITVNNAQSYQAACIAGLGLIQVPTMVNPHGLVEVLPAFVTEPMPVSLLYAHRAGSKRLQAWLADVLAPRLID